MIQIKVTKKDQLVITGHTQADVCAAVSSVMYTTINAMYRYDKDAFNFDDNGEIVKLDILKHDNIIDMLFDNMCACFHDIELTAPDGCINIEGCVYIHET